MAQPTLMYGIGATKAGTSWLHRYLEGHPDCAMSYPKELHYFDGKLTGPNGWQVKAVERRIREFDAEFDTATPERQARINPRRAQLQVWADIMQTPGDNSGDYVEYLTAHAGQARLVGDVTPAYALLPVEILKTMAGLAPVTRFVYLLRDPVDRLWSNIRMTARRKAAQAADIAGIAERMVQQTLAAGVPERSDYKDALTRLDQAVPKASLFVGFYEQLFNSATIARLCAFLGISNHKADFSQKVHGGTPLALSDTWRAALGRMLAPQYAYAEARFGALPEAWTQNMVKV